jgi:hypothetical protein
MLSGSIEEARVDQQEREQMTISTRRVEYQADGLTMVGHLAIPEGDDKRPAVLIGHEGAGLDDIQRARADRLAEVGFIALAMDYHGGRWFTDGDEMRARVRPLLASPERMRSIGRAALDALIREPRVDSTAVAATGLLRGRHSRSRVGARRHRSQGCHRVPPVVAECSDRRRVERPRVCPRLRGVGGPARTACRPGGVRATDAGRWH